MTTISKPASRLMASIGRTRRRKFGVGKTASLVILAIVASSTVYPLFFLTLIALKTPEDYYRDQFGLPSHPTLESFVTVLGLKEFLSGFTVSLLICTATTVVAALIGSMAGYSLAKLAMPARNAIKVSMVILMIVPATILIVPTFTMVLALGLQNNVTGLILVYLGLQLPFATYMMTSFFQSVPDELLQAASIDGAGPIRVFISIVLPLAKPALAALGTLVFLSTWNDLLFALVILQRDGARTLQVTLTLLNNPIQATPMPIVMAGLLLSTIPNLIIFAAFNRQLTKGITAGALK